ncbi:DNA alkylation repair protein [Pseudochryseolinea flava]|uniref:DNA alkylation repair protein n=1 Tax=Pseudochryseolinea flava TaxID=2059302 RepID=A0A364Y136_9BACT|nr:DNA alkylation repair protein [Pseudochryseolinea flava]RAW00551.1 hypothetical protein DQQ10_13205 [Pseudochryseolinea flava]
MNSHHRDLLEAIEHAAGEPTQHTFSDTYLGNSNPRFAINAPTLRAIARTWSMENKALSQNEFVTTIDSLIKGVSSTEKMLAGMLLDRATADQRAFNPKSFDKWLEHLCGWAEVDVVCTGAFTSKTLPLQPNAWSPLLTKFSKSKDIHKRRASLVFLCSPMSHHKASWMEAIAIHNIERLKSEKEILITKAISWLLRSMIKNYRSTVEKYLKLQGDTLPAIALRETKTKLLTGRK